MKTYKLFSKYVIETFLTDDKKGEFASLIIDGQFMNSAASKNEISVDIFIEKLCSELFSLYSNPVIEVDSVIAIVALQLYTASIREVDEEHSAKAYNIRLCDTIDCDDGDLKAWYKENQEKVWMKFYEWCRKNNFVVKECQPRSGSYRFVQYPLELAKYIFNRDDLKYMASVFVKYKLQPNENVLYSDFWKIFDIRFDFKNCNIHSQKVIDTVFEDSGNYEIIKSQIYNYYIIWSGEYINPYEKKIKKTNHRELFQIHLSDKDYIYRIDIRKEDGVKITDFKIDTTFIQELSKYYSYKRDGVIIFQRDKDGDLNYWDETRFIENKNQSGLAIVSKYSKHSKFHGGTVVSRYGDIVIYEFKYNNLTDEFYSNAEQIFELIGGLRIARNTYLIGGEPIFRIQNDCSFLINGKTHPITKGDHQLVLPEGDHILKFPRSRELKITMVSPSNKSILWSGEFCKWEVNKREKKWLPASNEEGIVGLNFECYSKSKESNAILKRWAKAQQCESIDCENNISLKLLNYINNYE